MEEAKRREDATRLTHPGLGPVNALAFVLTIGPVSRFQRSKKDRELSGTESERKIQRRKTANGSDQQAGQHHGALVVDRSSKSRGAVNPALRQDYQRLKFRRGHTRW